MRGNRPSVNPWVLLGVIAVTSGCADLFGRHQARPDSPTAAEPTARTSAALRWARSAAGQGAPEVLRGNVIIRSAPGGPDYEVLLDVHDGAQAPDGTADRVWVLQRNGPRRAIRPMVIDDARLYSRPGELLVAPPGGPYAIEFTIGDFPERLTERLPRGWQEDRARFLGGKQIGQRWSGVGVIQRFGQWPLAADANLPVRASLGLPKLFLGIGPNVFWLACSSGGPGSTACSITVGNSSCSANCQTGYYACCNSGVICNCTCEPVSTDGSGGGGGGSGGNGGCGSDSYLAFDRGNWVCVQYAN